MSNPHDRDSDRSLDLLSDHAGVPADEGLRSSILQRTTRVVRRRRIAKRVAIGVVCVVCYSAGLLTTRWFASANPSAEVVAVNSEQPVPTTEPLGQSSPWTLEWQAVDSAVNRPDLFKQAGDRYLHEFGDLAAAVRCYRSALEIGSAADTTVGPDDSWLLIALKQAKAKEKLDASLDS